ncbi:hypothetical protein PSTT_04901 [Puccinia striiformis]|uniref:Uncharacterized protein n=1 Tax=Puccinia striiformis TaxID=27350 RepID=A0A2S4VQT0_9BASI|nr:hypothetical protein PSTT_04901 [Puccinia striiformis]
MDTRPSPPTSGFHVTTTHNPAQRLEIQEQSNQPPTTWPVCYRSVKTGSSIVDSTLSVLFKATNLLSNWLNCTGENSSFQSYSIVQTPKITSRKLLIPINTMNPNLNPGQAEESQLQPTQRQGEPYEGIFFEETPVDRTHLAPVPNVVERKCGVWPAFGSSVRYRALKSPAGLPPLISQSGATLLRSGLDCPVLTSSGPPSVSGHARHPLCLSSFLGPPLDSTDAAYGIAKLAESDAAYVHASFPPLFPSLGWVVAQPVLYPNRSSLTILPRSTPSIPGYRTHSTTPFPLSSTTSTMPTCDRCASRGISAFVRTPTGLAPPVKRPRPGAQQYANPWTRPLPAFLRFLRPPLSPNRTPPPFLLVRGRRHNFSRTPSPFLKRLSVAGMVPRPSSISGASRPPKRRAEADPSAAVIAWFDNRRVIQSYLGIPFDQPVPAFEDSVAIQFSQRASPAAPVIDIDDVRTPVGSPTRVTSVSEVGSPPRTAPVNPLDKGKERAVTPRPPADSVDNDEERATTPRPSIDRRERTDARAGSTFTDRTPTDLPWTMLIPTMGWGLSTWSFLRRPLARTITTFARRYMPALIVNEFLRYIDDAYIITLQWSAFTPSDRRNRYELFHTNCQLLRNSANDVIPFNNRFGTRAPRVTPLRRPRPSQLVRFLLPKAKEILRLVRTGLPPKVLTTILPVLPDSATSFLLSLSRFRCY